MTFRSLFFSASLSILVSIVLWQSRHSTVSEPTLDRTIANANLDRTIADATRGMNAADATLDRNTTGLDENPAHPNLDRSAALEAIHRKQAQASEGPKRFDEPNRAAEFFYKQRLAPGASELPHDHLRSQLETIRNREALLEAGGERSPGDIESWQSVGPGNIGGRTRAIVVNPLEPDIMYAAGVAGGVFKSTDGGESWVPTDDLMLNLAVTTIAIDPVNPNVLYAGTGEVWAEGSPFVRGLGIFKTTDAGETWNQLLGTVNGVPDGSFHFVTKIVISPNQSNRLYAATQYGVWRSTNAGANWQPILSNPWYLSIPPTSQGCQHGCTDLAIRSDRNPDVLYAAFGVTQQDGLYRSEDGGNTWTRQAMGFNQGRITIAIAPSNNDIVYLAMADNGASQDLGRIAGVYRATDGRTFVSRLDWAHEFSPWLFSYLSIGTGCFEYPYVPSQGWYDNAIAVDPLDSDILWLGGIDLFRSNDGGRTFGLAEYWFYYLENPQPPVYVHPDQHAIVFHPDFDGVTNQTLYVGNDGGLFRTFNARAATSQEECPMSGDPGPAPEIAWHSINHGYGVTQFYHGDAARQVDLFVGGAQDNGSSRGLSRNAPDDWRLLYGGDGGYVAIDPTNSDRFFIEIQGFPQILRTTDGGDTFVPATNGITDTDGLFITPFAMDPSDPDILWTGGTRPWRTTNGGNSWVRVGPNIPTVNQISAIAVAPSDGNIVYLGFDNGYLARTTNGLGASPTWTVLTNGVQAGAWVSSVAVDPANPSIAYCTYSSYDVQHVLRTTNSGASWVSIDGIAETGVPDIPAHWIAVRPADPSQLYVGTELGVFVSDDSGATWFPANTGLAHTIVEALDFQDDNTIVAFTHGRGVFVTDLIGGAGIEDGAAATHFALAAEPNPFASSVMLRAVLPQEGHVSLRIHDAAGRQVAHLLDESHEAGAMAVRWEAREPGSRLPAGTYFAHLAVDDLATTRRLVLLP